ncbi:MAG: N utilization substance protein B [Gammaproteobacteria bacterium RIFCSPHIGHO2_12_FULL_41_20]|nr:MAG: N utilization substance protein B [Gammaproteobacteria bacterium RIFCSPHIGHO2_12_FULL_41_20]
MPENKRINPQARHNARHYAVQALYQWQLTGASGTDIENQFLKHQISKQVDLEYFKELLHGIVSEQKTLDEHMHPYLKRQLHELDPVELAVLRLAIYELTKRPDVPYRVIINEALELTKKFGSVEGYKFVNGVLDQVARKIRAHEIGEKKTSS